MRLEHSTILTVKDTESMNIAKKSLIDFLEKKSGGEIVFNSAHAPRLG